MQQFNIAMSQMAHSNIAAFIQLSEAKNHLAAMAIIRMHLNCLMKLFSIFIISPQDKWLNCMLFSDEETWKKCIEINNKKQRITDTFLCGELEKQGSFHKALELYRYSSDFIHPSDKHFSTAIKEWKQDENEIRWSTAINIFGICEINEDIQKSNYNCMLEISDAIIKCLSFEKVKNTNFIKYKLV